MTDTPKLGLTYLEASQAQKHVTVNDALRQLDGLVQASAADKDLTAPPGSPSTGDAYIVAAGATGVWAGQDGKLAVYHDTAWYFYTPAAGWLVYVEDEAEHYAFNGAAWVTYASLIGGNFVAKTGDTMTGDLLIEQATDVNSGLRATAAGADTVWRIAGNRTGATTEMSVLEFGNDTDDIARIVATDPAADKAQGRGQLDFKVADALTLATALSIFYTGYLRAQVGLGVNTDADASNRLAVNSDNVLFNNNGGSSNMKVNKNASGNDASVTLQDAFSTKALFGLLGNDDFTLKVGSSFITAMIADETTGKVAFPEGFQQEKLQAYKDATTQTVTASWATITNWDGTHIDDGANLTWGAAGGDCYIGKDGTFLVSYSVSTEVSAGTGRSDTSVKLQRYSGSTWVDVEGTIHRMYNRQANLGGTNAAWTGVLELASGDGLRLQVILENGTDTPIVDQASLMILRM